MPLVENSYQTGQYEYHTITTNDMIKNKTPKMALMPV